MTVLLQLFFYATGTAPLEGASFWLALAAFALVVWLVHHLRNRLRGGKALAT
jgi:hypothetical protein